MFDIIISSTGVIVLLPVFLVTYLLACVDTGSNGWFFQQRVGRHGKLFMIYKLKTVHPQTHNISSLGKWFRKYKLDELPQLFNVLNGSMSLVGPRPDVPGYYDRLKKEERCLLELRPGITSAAAIKYRNEEALLSKQVDPDDYNDHVLFPDKVRMNLHYYHTRSFWGDICILLRTLSRH